MAYADTLYAGDLVMLDMFIAGFPKGKVLGPADGRDFPGGATGVRVKVTADSGAYKRGEILTVPGGDVIPRQNVRTIGGQYRIRSVKYYRLNESRPR